MESDVPSLGTPIGAKAQEYVNEEYGDADEELDGDEFETDVKKEEPESIFYVPWIQSNTGGTRTPKTSRQSKPPGAPVARKKRRRVKSQERTYVENYNTEADKKGRFSATRTDSTTTDSTHTDPIAVEERHDYSKGTNDLDGGRCRTPFPPMRRRAAPPPTTPEERTLVINAALSAINTQDAKKLRNIVPVWVNTNRETIDAAVYQWRPVSKTGRTLYDSTCTNAAYTKALVEIINSMTRYYANVRRNYRRKKELQMVW